jgi:hypothetical protein
MYLRVVHTDDKGGHVKLFRSLIALSFAAAIACNLPACGPGPVPVGDDDDCTADGGHPYTVADAHVVYNVEIPDAGNHD